MRYERIKKAVFLSRPNRFIANIELDGELLVCHVKNTGRCRELLVPGASVLVQMADSAGRKTPCDLIAVWKGERLINMDAQAPNKVFGEWLAAGGLGFVPTFIKPEYSHGDSRFDFCFTYDGRMCLAEIKGVTLEEDGVVRFPDAPTERGVKHLHGLTRAVKEGYECYVVFVIQLRHVSHFEPNRRTHPEFADALWDAAKAGVHVLALDCEVTEDGMEIAEAVKIQI